MNELFLLVSEQMDRTLLTTNLNAVFARNGVCVRDSCLWKMCRGIGQDVFESRTRLALATLARLPVQSYPAQDYLVCR